MSSATVEGAGRLAELADFAAKRRQRWISEAWEPGPHRITKSEVLRVIHDLKALEDESVSAACPLSRVEALYARADAVLRSVASTGECGVASCSELLTAADLRVAAKVSATREVLENAKSEKARILPFCRSLIRDQSQVEVQRDPTWRFAQRLISSPSSADVVDALRALTRSVSSSWDVPRMYEATGRRDPDSIFDSDVGHTILASPMAASLSSPPGSPGLSPMSRRLQRSGSVALPDDAATSVVSTAVRELAAAATGIGAPEAWHAAKQLIAAAVYAEMPGTGSLSQTSALADSEVPTLAALPPAMDAVSVGTTGVPGNAGTGAGAATTEPRPQSLASPRAAAAQMPSPSPSPDPPTLLRAKLTEFEEARLRRHPALADIAAASAAAAEAAALNAVLGGPGLGGDERSLDDHHDHDQQGKGASGGVRAVGEAGVVETGISGSGAGGEASTSYGSGSGSSGSDATGIGGGSSSAADREWLGSGSCDWESCVTAGLEKLVFTRLHRLLFGAPRGSAGRDTRCFVLLRTLRRFIGPAQLDLPQDMPSWLTPVWLLAQEALAAISRYAAPGDKVECVLNACRVLSVLLSYHRSEVQGGSPHVAADDFLPALIYTLLQAAPPHIVSELRYISDFARPSLMMSQAGFYVTSLMSALSFMRGARPDQLAMSHESFARAVADALPAALIEAAATLDAEASGVTSGGTAPLVPSKGVTATVTAGTAPRQTTGISAPASNSGAAGTPSGRAGRPSASRRDGTGTGRRTRGASAVAGFMPVTETLLVGKADQDHAAHATAAAATSGPSVSSKRASGSAMSSTRGGSQKGDLLEARAASIAAGRTPGPEADLIASGESDDSGREYSDDDDDGDDGDDGDDDGSDDDASGVDGSVDRDSEDDSNARAGGGRGHADDHGAPSIAARRAARADTALTAGSTLAFDDSAIAQLSNRRRLPSDGAAAADTSFDSDVPRQARAVLLVDQQQAVGADELAAAVDSSGLSVKGVGASPVAFSEAASAAESDSNSDSPSEDESGHQPTITDVSTQAQQTTYRPAALEVNHPAAATVSQVLLPSLFGDGVPPLPLHLHDGAKAAETDGETSMAGGGHEGKASLPEASVMLVPQAAANGCADDAVIPKLDCASVASDAQASIPLPLLVQVGDAVTTKVDTSPLLDKLPASAAVMPSAAAVTTPADFRKRLRELRIHHALSPELFPLSSAAPSAVATAGPAEHTAASAPPLHIGDIFAAVWANPASGAAPGDALLRSLAAAEHRYRDALLQARSAFTALQPLLFNGEAAELAWD